MSNHDIGDTGDAACWLDRVCERCGGLIEADQPHECRQPAPATGADADTDPDPGDQGDPSEPK